MALPSPVHYYPHWVTVACCCSPWIPQFTLQTEKLVFKALKWFPLNPQLHSASQGPVRSALTVFTLTLVPRAFLDTHSPLHRGLPCLSLYPLTTIIPTLSHHLKKKKNLAILGLNLGALKYKTTPLPVSNSFSTPHSVLYVTKHLFYGLPDIYQILLFVLFSLRERLTMRAGTANLLTLWHNTEVYKCVGPRMHTTYGLQDKYTLSMMLLWN